MSRGGARPGAGRPKNEPNVADRQIRTAGYELTKRVISGSQQSPLETMLYKRDYWMRIVATEMAKGAAANQKTIQKALDKAEESAVRAARYVHPALAAIAIREQPYDLSKLTDAQLAELERLAHVAAITGSDQGGTTTTQH